MTVSPNPSLSATSSHTVLCIGNTATLIAFGAASYSWSNGQTGITATVSPSVETTYTLIGSINGICQQTVTITQSVDPCIGMAELNKGNAEIKVFPNPNNGAFTIYAFGINDNSSVQLFNALGQAILSEKIKSSATELNLKYLPQGIYFIQLKEKDSVISTKRIIIQ